MKRTTTPWIYAAVCLFLTGSCDSSPGPASTSDSVAPPAIWFRNVSRERGLAFTHLRGDEGRYWLPEIMGGGVGLFDFENDGDLDCYLVQSGDLSGPDDEAANQLFLNRLIERGKALFENVTASVGGGDRGYGMGCVAGDCDGDGRIDLYVTNVGQNTLFHNVAGAELVDTTAHAGVGHPGWATSGAFLDHDRDGDLDLFAVNYLRWSIQREKDCLSEHGENDYCSPRSYDAPAPDVLYENRGDGTFEDITTSAGIDRAFGNGLGVVAAELDGDGLIDIYVANDMMPNQLWKNRGDGTFEDIALFAGCAANMDGASEASMGTVAVDVENDGDLDLFLTHLRDETNTFYQNSAGIFSDRTAAIGLATPSRFYTGFGVCFGDFDQDGVLDLFVANGAVTRNRPRLAPQDPYAEPNQLFRGTIENSRSALHFEEVLRGGLERALIRTSRGAALGDLDNDGDLDIVVVDSNANVELLENVVATGHWLQLSLIDGGTAAIGASARIRLDSKNLWRSVLPAASYCSSNAPRLHFGLGRHTEPVEVHVRWSDGVEEDFGSLALDRVHRLERTAQ